MTTPTNPNTEDERAAEKFSETHAESNGAYFGFLAGIQHGRENERAGKAHWREECLRTADERDFYKEWCTTIASKERFEAAKKERGYA